MNDIKNSSAEMPNMKQIKKDANVIATGLNKIQQGIESNTKALQELNNAYTVYQKTLNNSHNIQLPVLDEVKNLISAMDTVEKITSKFKNVGRGKMFPLIYC